MHPVKACRLAVLALLACGCSSSGTLAPTPSTCQSPACPVAPLQYAAEVIPANGSTALESEFAAIDPRTGQFVLTLPPTVTLNGTVQIGTGTSQHFVPSTVRASRPSRILGQPDLVYSATLNTMPGTTMTGAYSMQVTPTLPGEVYTLRVITDDPTKQYPPQTFSIPVPADTRFALKLDDSTRLLQVHGTITDALMNPQSGFTVQALDQATLRSVSTVTATDLNGQYVILLSQQEATKQVILTVQPPTSDLPTLQRIVDLSKPGAGNSLTVNLAMPPGQNAQKFTYPIVGNSSSGALDAVPFATCAFTADVSNSLTPDVTATVYVVTQTDARGYATANLIPSRTYTLTVEPPGGSAYATTTQQLTVGPTGGTGQQIMLNLRPRVTASVLGPNGKGMPNVAVITGVSSGDQQVNGRAEQIVQLPSTVSDPTGGIVLRLDGSATFQYDLGLVPPPASGAARTWLESLRVQADLDLGNVTLPIGTLVFGQVIDSKGLPVHDAQVRIYSIAATNAACVKGNLACVSPPREIAEGTTDGNGGATFTLPSSAPSLPGKN